MNPTVAVTRIASTGFLIFADVYLAFPGETGERRLHLRSLRLARAESHWLLGSPRVAAGPETKVEAFDLPDSWRRRVIQAIVRAAIEADILPAAT